MLQQNYPERNIDMELIDKKNKQLLEEYEDFVKNSEYANFMQSLRWPKVKDNWGWDAVISRDSQGKIRGTCLVIIKKIPVFPTSFLYAPHGPVCDWSDKEVMADIFEGVKVLAKKYSAYQFMMDPPFEEKERDRSKIITDMGFSFALDDFGTGNANYSYIIKYPFCLIKIDKSFLWGSEKNAENATILRNMVNLISELDRLAVVEGVETVGQKEKLIANGVRYLQGYYYSKPVPEDDFTKYIRDFNANTSEEA